VLRRTALLPDGDIARLCEAHAMECYHIADMPAAIASWRRAIAVWHDQGNQVREGMNLAVLAAALASAGKRQDARRANQAAIELLSAAPPGREVALAYSTQAILHQYTHELSDAIALAEHAVALANQAGDTEIAVMAYDTLGMSSMFLDYAVGCGHLEHARDLAREHGLDAAVARAYGDLGAVSVAVLELDRAERYLEEGLAFTDDRDLDRTRLLMLAWRAAGHLFRGRWSEAAIDAAEVLERPASTSARVVALLTLGRLEARQGAPESAASLLDQALTIAGTPDELRVLGPVRAARAEAAALAGDRALSLAETDAVFDLAVAKRHHWLTGELAYWRWRAGVHEPQPRWLPGPFLDHVAGHWRAAADAWRALGCPYEEARALADGDQTAQQQALAIFDRLGAQTAAADLRRKMRVQGVRSVPRGPQRATRSNRYGLTRRQVEILGLLAQGCTNVEIARRMSIAPKTAEHHVAAVLAKLDVQSRQAATRLARDEQLIP
jgi:DNA-binding CsgD family transcriptional regulator/tetratricopeptide (TPR) repeat protein